MSAAQLPVKVDGRRARGARTRARIVEAATELFRGHGFHGVSLEEIATAAGISGPAVYRHFASKEEVLEAVMAPALDALVSPAARPRDDPYVFLWQFFTQLTHFSANHPGTVALCYQEWRNLPADRRSAFRDELVRRVDVLARAIRAVRPQLNPAEGRLAAGAALTVAAHVGYPGSGRRLSTDRQATLLRDMAMLIATGEATDTGSSAVDVIVSRS